MPESETLVVFRILGVLAKARNLGHALLALATLYLLAIVPNARRLRRLLSVAIRRAAHRHEHWLIPVNSQADAGRRRGKY
jgi:hypothetical protein